MTESKHLLGIGDEDSKLPIENLEHLLQDMCDKGITELGDAWRYNLISQWLMSLTRLM